MGRIEADVEGGSGMWGVPGSRGAMVWGICIMGGMGPDGGMGGRGGMPMGGGGTMPGIIIGGITPMGGGIIGIIPVTASFYHRSSLCI